MKLNKPKQIAIAQRLIEQGNYRRAITIYQKIVRADVTDVRAKLKLADLYTRVDLIKDARELLLSVAEEYERHNTPLKAVPVYKHLVKVVPDDYQIRLRLARTYRQLGLFNDAANEYRHTVMELGQPDQLNSRADVVRELLDLDPDNLSARVKLAEDFARLDRSAEVVDLLKYVCERLRKAKKRDDFAKISERYLYFQPDDFETSKELAAYYTDNDFPQKALPRLRTCFSARPRDPEVLEMLVRCFELLGQGHKSIVVLKALASIYHDAGLQREYEDTLYRLLELDPDDAEARKVYEGDRQEPLPVSPEIVFEDIASSQTGDRPVYQVAAVPPQLEASPGDDVELEVVVEVIEEPKPIDVSETITEVVVDDDDDDHDAAFEFDNVISLNTGLVIPAVERVVVVDDEELPFVHEQEIPLTPESIVDDDVTLVDRRVELPKNFFQDARNLSPGISIRGVPGPKSSAKDSLNRSYTQSSFTQATGAPVVDDDSFDFGSESADDVARLEGTKGAVAMAIADIGGELKEFDFFLEIGSISGAQSILDDLLERFPGHPEVTICRLRMAEALSHKRGSEPTIEPDDV